MAGNDHKMDTKAGIANFIEQNIRELLNYDMNEYQNPAWVQAAELFDEVVVPCEAYFSRGLYALGIDLVKEAEKYGCKEVFQKIPGMYNVKQVSGDVYSKEEVEEFDHSSTINSIKEWIAQMKVRLDRVNF